MWDVTYAHFVDGLKMPSTFKTSDEVVEWANSHATVHGVGFIEVEDFSDEVHIFFRDKRGKRRRLLCVQLG